MLRIASLVKNYLIRMRLPSDVQVGAEGIATQFFNLFYALSANKDGFWVKSESLRVSKAFLIFAPITIPAWLLARRFHHSAKTQLTKKEERSSRVGSVHSSDGSHGFILPVLLWLGEFASVNSEGDHVQLNISKEGLAIITLNRPRVNAMTIEMIRSLRKYLEEIKSNPAIKVIVIKSYDQSGKFFGAGADILELRKAINQRHPEIADQFYREEYEAYYELAQLHQTKPVVIIANGTTMGSHMGLAMTGILVATKNSRFAMPETKIGFFPDVGATHLLPKRVGLPLAKFMGLTSYVMSGVEAYRVGLADVYTSDKTLGDLKESIEEFI